MRRWLALVSVAALLIAGAVPAWMGFVDRSAEEIPWGLLVPGYVLFALMATGSSIENSIYTVFGCNGPNGEYEKIIKLGVWFSLITIMPAWIMILLDLPNPLSVTSSTHMRAYRCFSSTSPPSLGWLFFTCCSP